MVRIKPGQKYWFCTQFSWNLWRLFAIDNFSLFRAAGKYFLAGFCQLVFKFYVINFRVGRFFCLKKSQGSGYPQYLASFCKFALKKAIIITH